MVNVLGVIGFLAFALFLGLLPWALFGCLIVALLKKRTAPSSQSPAPGANARRPKEPFGQRFAKTVVGGIIILIVAAIFDALTFVLLSIVCTAGIMLFAWLLMAYYVGSFAFLLFQFFRGGRGRKTASGGETPAERRSGNQLAISQYLAEATRYGLTREEITQRLRDQGWPDNEIQQAYGGGAVPV